MNDAPVSCRACRSTPLQPVLSLGTMPLANALLTPEQLTQPEPAYPLELAFCPRCTLLQITETVAPEQLFQDYLYYSSYSETMLRHAEALVTHLIRARRLDAASLVVELGSNDGYLLQYFVARGVPVLGIEPARNVAQAAEAKGVRTICEFFGEELARRLHSQGHAADVVIANNVLAHVADLNGVVEGLRLLLKPSGVAVIEVPYVKDLLDRGEFDTIYHEHLCYFSATALDRLFGAHRMVLADIERLPIHGGSLRLTVAQQGQADRSQAVRALLDEEASWGVNRLEPYLAFPHKAEQIKTSLRSLLGSLRRQGRRTAAYGAAAKGTVLLNYCGLGPELVEFVVDRNPHKQGRYVPGVHLPIYAPAALLERMPDYVLVLTWNLAEEVLAQQADYQRRGGRFILPIPEPRILEPAAERA